MELSKLSNLRVQVILLVLIAVIPFLFMIAWSTNEDVDIETKEIKDHALQLVRLAAANQASIIESAHHLLIAVAQLPAVRHRDVAACNQHFAQLLKEYSLYNNLRATDPKGNMFASAVPLDHAVNVADRQWFQRVMKTHKFVVGDFTIGSITLKPTLVFALPILNQTGDVESVVSVSLNLNVFHQLISKVALPHGAIFTVYDNDGTILTRKPDPEKWIGKTPTDAPIVQAILDRKEGVEEIAGLDRVKRLYAFTPVGDKKEGIWFVSIGIPESIAFAPVYRELTTSLIWMGITSLLALAAAWYVGGSFIVKPINALLKAANQLKTGNLNERSNLSYKAGELGELARDFDAMADTLQQNIKEIKRASIKIQEQATLLDQAHDAIHVRNMSDVIIYWNKGAEHLYGWTAAEAIGQKADRLLYKDTSVFQKLKRKIVDETGFWTGELVHAHKNGQEVTVESSWTLVRDSENRPKSFFIISTDITDRKRAEAKIV